MGGFRNNIMNQRKKNRKEILNYCELNEKANITYKNL